MKLINKIMILRYKAVQYLGNTREAKCRYVWLCMPKIRCLKWVFAVTKGSEQHLRFLPSENRNSFIESHLIE